TCRTTGYRDEPLIGPIFEGGHDLGLVVVGGYLYRGPSVPELQGRCIFGYWTDSRAVGNGILLVATPPEGWHEGERPGTAADLNAEGNTMWRSQKLKVTGHTDEFLGMFVRGFGMDANQDMYVVTNDAGGPDASTSTGKVWKIVSPQ
ncbi:MAG: plastocyanin, partial [Methanoculleus sp.]